ncbi:hypothetical protein TAO_0436 [Candidatus Nitrosoglobus terrae]|uniref:Lipoprotein n=1 Tax=Candidatus Nitrosoglobus terrae TaxID=1630141 RepID=A0A1Q2SKY4_9GAMM|nr:hypothetical protein [Candidatus Nitrosoglobus terrae]BAW79806.1 hypothetical protein TAO_0436 [Candidatus Nitrosoglobus terrae]
MLKRLYFLLTIASLLIAACSSGPARTYAKGNHKGSVWNVDGDFNEGSNSLKIYINGYKAISGRLSFFGDTAIMNGEYQGEEASAHCRRRGGTYSDYVRCTVFVNGQKAATIQW